MRKPHQRVPPAGDRKLSNKPVCARIHGRVRPMTETETNICKDLYRETKVSVCARRYIRIAVCRIHLGIVYVCSLINEAGLMMCSGRKRRV
jgi:hypothetical protein